MRALVWSLVGLMSLTSYSASTQARTWRDATGRFSLEAEFVAASKDALVLRKSADGSFVIIPLAKLSRADQGAARELAATAPSKPAAPGASDKGIDVNARGLSDAETRQFQQHWLSKLSLDIKPHDSAALAKVFAGQVYQVTTTQETGQGTMSQEELVVHDGENFRAVQHPTTDEDFPFLLDLVKGDFKLKTKQNAQEFEAALDALYDVGNFGNDEKEIRQKGKQWIFVRGKFFKDASGFIVTTGFFCRQK